MRQFFLFIVIAAIAYLAFTFSKDRLARPLTEDGDDRPLASTPLQRVRSAASPAPPVFKSKIPERASTESLTEKRLAPPGIYYMVDRVSVETTDGVIAIGPGDQVRFVNRNGDRLRVKTDSAEFDVKETQITNDLDLAHAAEESDFARRTRER